MSGIDDALRQIPDGWYWERMFRFPTGYLVSLLRFDGLGVAQAQGCETLVDGLLKASERARNWDKETS